MSITIHTQPQQLTPVYNQMIIAVTSSNQSEESFQFVGDIYVAGNLVTRMKVPVNPDGYGVFDIHRHVENEVTYTFTPDSFGWTQAVDSYATYSVEFSEEFRFEWNYYDYIFDGGSVAYIGVSGGPEPLFNIGDEIFINAENGTPVEYNGIAEITGITQSNLGGAYPWLAWIVDTNKFFSNSGPTLPGTMSLSNFGLNILSTTGSTGQLEVWNGVETFQDFITYDYTDYVPDLVSYGIADWLTNVPQNYKIGTQSQMKLLLFKDATNQQKDFYVKTNNTGTFRITSAYSGSTPLGYDALTQIACGPWDLTNNGQVGFTSSIVTGTSSLPIFDANTTSYEIWTQNQILQVDTGTLSFQIDTSCSRYEKVQLIFMDKKGSFIPFVFDRVNKENRNISRTNYQQKYGSYAPATQNWGYNSYDRGKKSLDTVVTENYTVHSNWVDQTTSNFLMELYESPQVYWINEDGLTQAINITSTTTERKQTINDQIINYTLTFELSNKNQSQRG
jgi:hypothetical protein